MGLLYLLGLLSYPVWLCIAFVFEWLFCVNWGRGVEGGRLSYTLGDNFL